MIRARAQPAGWVHRFLSTSTVRSFRSGPGLDQNSRRKRTISLASRRPEQCGCWRKSSRAGAVACAPRFNSTDMMRWILPVPSVAQLAKNAIPCSLAQQHANLRRSSLAVKNSLHKRPPKRLDLTLNPAVKTVGTPMGLSTFQELDEVKEEEEAEEVGEEEEEGGAKR